MTVPRRVEVWSDLHCQGGTRLAVFRGITGATRTRRTGALPELTIRYPAAAAAHTQVQEWRVIRFDYSDSVFEEWVVVRIGELKADYTVEVHCAGPGLKFANAIVSRSDADGRQTFDFEAPGLTPSEQIAAYILKAATDAGMAFALGTVDPTAPCDMRYGFGQENGWDSALSAVQRLAQVVRNPTGGACEADFRRNGTTNYLVDFLHQIGSAASTFHVRFQRNLPTGWRRHRTTDRQATRVYPQGAPVDNVAASMARARWKVTAKSSNTLTLADPAGGDGPVGFDDQLNNLYVRRIDGSLTQVSDCTASTQQVVVADATGIEVNHIIEFRRTSTGDDLTYLEHPTAKATYGLVSRVLRRPDVPGTVNLGDNTVCREYTGGGSAVPDRWSKVGNPTITQKSVGTAADRPYIRYGPNSFRMQGAADGEGVDTPYSPISPSVSGPIFPGFLGFWLEAGKVRVELIAAKDTKSVSGITRSGTTATVTTGAAHGLAKGDRVEILGSDQSAYNGIKIVTTVPTSTTFTVEVVGSPTTPATGTMTAAWCRRIPEGTEGQASTSKTKQWIELGVDDQATNLNTLGATRAKFRILQDGTTAVDCYVNYFQITQSATQQPFIEGAGPNRLWQESNRYLKAYNVPLTRYEGSALNLREIDPLTWPWDTAAPTLGGPIKVVDDYFGTVETRILGLSDDPFSPVVNQLTLSDDPGDLLDMLVGDRRPPAQPKQAQTTVLPDIQCVMSRPPGTPATVSCRLATVPTAGVPIYYWVGAEITEPPPVALVQAGPPSDTAWGTYTQPFSVNQVQTTDLKVWAYCQVGERRRVQSFRVDRDDRPAITSLTLQETPSLALKASWTPDDDTRSARVYVRVGDWPCGTLKITSLTRESSTATAVTQSPHGLVTGDIVKVSEANGSQYNIEATVTVVDTYTFTYTVGGSPTTPDTSTTIKVRSGRNTPDHDYFKAEKSVDPTAGGVTSAGVPTAGGTEYTQASFSNSDQVYVVVVPKDYRGNIGAPEARGAKKITMAAAPNPTVFNVSAIRISDGIECDSDGAQYTFSWSSTDLTDGTHKVRVFAGGNSALDTSPVASPSINVASPFKRTSGKWDPTVEVTLSWELLDGSDNVIQSGSLPSDSFTSTCGF